MHAQCPRRKAPSQPENNQRCANLFSSQIGLSGILVKMTDFLGHRRLGLVVTHPLLLQLRHPLLGATVTKAMTAVGEAQLSLAGGRKALTPGPTTTDVIKLTVVHTPIDHQAGFRQPPGFQGRDQFSGQHHLAYQTTLADNGVPIPLPAGESFRTPLAVTGGKPQQAAG